MGLSDGESGKDSLGMLGSRLLSHAAPLRRPPPCRARLSHPPPAGLPAEEGWPASGLRMPCPRGRGLQTTWLGDLHPRRCGTSLVFVQSPVVWEVDDPLEVVRHNLLLPYPSVFTHLKFLSLSFSRNVL